uniref:EamA domain-containing protein n=1 Tax=Octactis speculum TaxID=3111310 RepID=A0A7S2GAX6_9STRA
MGSEYGCKIAWPKLMLAQALGQIILSIPCAYFVGPPIVFPRISQWLLLCAIGALGFGSQVCMTYGMQNAKTASAALTRQAGVVFGFVYQITLFPSERLHLSTILGAIIISGSVAGLVFYNQRHNKQSSRQLALQRREDSEPYLVLPKFKRVAADGGTGTQFAIAEDAKFLEQWEEEVHGRRSTFRCRHYFDSLTHWLFGICDTRGPWSHLSVRYEFASSDLESDDIWTSDL